MIALLHLLTSLIQFLIIYQSFHSTLIVYQVIDLYYDHQIILINYMVLNLRG
jgi:hypothetical protein